MRLGVQMLALGSTLNSYSKKSTVEIAQGETVDLLFQFIDKDQSGLRFIPADGAEVFVDIARFPESFPTITNQRIDKDFSIRRAAVQAFPEDASIWKLVITADETSEMMSTNIRVKLTEGSSVKIALVPQAIRVIRKEDI